MSINRRLYDNTEDDNDEDAGNDDDDDESIYLLAMIEIMLHMSCHKSSLPKETGRIKVKNE